MKRNHPDIPDLEVYAVAQRLKWLVAKHLSAPADGGELRPDEVEVDVHERNHLDIAGKDIQIVVFAHDYPSRKQNLEQRKDLMLEDLKGFINSKYSVFLWILLCPSAYGEFAAR
ncbi:MAG: hypothetical protein Q8O51_01545 [bacterium]|nr:hypothetical protein [bacterium]